jgi:hypothetical protein
MRPIAARLAIALGCAGLCHFLLPSVAAAQSNDAQASALFDQGLAGMQQGKYAAACPQLRESYRLDPKAGVMFTLSECEAKAGLVASASTHYREYLGLVPRLPAADQTRHTERVGIAQSQLKALAPTVPMITVEIDAPEGTAFKVARNGELLGKATLGLPLPTDPGTYEWSLSTEAGVVQTQQLTVAPKDRKTIKLFLSGKTAAVSATTTDSAPNASGSSSSAPLSPASSPPATKDSAPSGTDRAWLSWTFVGVAGAALVVGGVTGGLALGKKSDIEKNCVGTVCNAQGKSAADSGQSLALVSTIAVTSAVVLGGVAVALFLTDKSSGGTGARAGAWQLLQGKVQF